MGVFSVGELVASRYRVERFVARGGMGEVYAVQDTSLEERVALKTIRDASADHVKAIRRLKSEVQLSRRIGHPNTCRIFEFGEHEALGGAVVYFFTMDLVEGETLGTKLRRDGPLPPALVTTIARQVLGGLSEAHGLGILHRDLKSDNIMLRLPPTAGLEIDAVIMDFGLALRLDSEQRLTSDSHALVGSLAYMAPEQVEGDKLTPATDLYAVGVILFEMLTGQLPFRASTPVSAAFQRLRQNPPKPSSLRPELAPSWDTLVLSCLARSVEKRARSARQVLTALDRLDASPGERSSSRRRRVALLVSAISGLGLLALVSTQVRRKSSGAPSAAIETVTVIAPAQPELPPPSSPLPAAPSHAPPPTPTVPRVGSPTAPRVAPAARRARRTRDSRGPHPPAAVPEPNPGPSPEPRSVGPLPLDTDLPR
jgi:serine/threonine protein kinase